MSPPKDLYEILGVKPEASADEIKRAYRTLAKRLHPDRTGGDKSKESRFKEISAAYGVLSDPDKRRRYDEIRSSPFPGAGGGPGGVPFDLGDLFGGGGPGGGFAGMGGFGDLFDQFFSGGPRRAGNRRVVFETFGGGAPRPARADEEVVRMRASDGAPLERRGADLHGELPISVEEAVLGTRAEVATLDGRVTVTIPPGTSSGQKLRLRGKGVGGRGDLLVTIQIVVPKDVDERARELVREFSRRAPVRPRR